jgi:DNA-binding transcriptional LysR family regulator
MVEQDLRALWVLSRVAALGSFAAAARELQLTRAAVSRLIGQTEKRLGVRLAERSTRQVLLTERALELVQAVGPALETVGAALQSLGEADTGLRGPIRLTCSHTLGQHLLMPDLAAFAQAHPAVKLELVWSDRIEDLIGQRIDIAVRLGDLPDSNLVARSVGRIRLALVAAPGLLRQHKRPRRPTDLAAWPCIAQRPPGMSQVRSWRFRTPEGPEHLQLSQPVAEVNSLEAAHALCLAGLGLAVLPAYLVVDDLATGHLTTVLPDQLDAGPPVHVCTTRRNLLPQRVQALLGIMQTGLSQRLRA